MYAPHKTFFLKFAEDNLCFVSLFQSPPCLFMLRSNMLPTNLPHLEALIEQGTVRRPINDFYGTRDYTSRELATLERLEADASKAIRRELSTTEKKSLARIQSTTHCFPISLEGLGLRCRYLRRCGNWVVYSQNQPILPERSLRALGLWSLLACRSWCICRSRSCE